MDALFDLEGAKPELSKSETQIAYEPITSVEVEKIRSAFSDAKIRGQDERKNIIEESVGREVKSLKHLLGHEVPRVIYALNDLILASRGPKVNDRSAWDDREEDTWIDKL